ncbi:MAG: methyltransferase domain-containing protein [Acidobacteriota bacterium]
MKDWLVQLLRDPVDGSALRLEGEKLVSAAGRTYPIVRGIPRFVPSDSYAGSFGYQWNRFAQTQLDSASGGTQSKDTFVEKTGLKLEDLRGKTVLDVGCGMGRFAEVVAEAGGRLVGIDLSSAVDAAAPNLARFENAAVVQADVFSLPFAPETFDLIYSIGVLHHTPDTRAAFLSLPRFLKPGGEIAVWLYARMLRWTLAMSRVYRLITTRLPKDRLLKLCRVADPLGAFERSGKVGTLVQFLIPVSNHPDPKWRILDTFDWYSPRYQWTHTDLEVEGWFREAGLQRIWHGSFPVSVRGAKI